MLKLKLQLFAEGDQVPPVENDPIAQNYLTQIEALKKQMATMVAGAEYDKVLAEHKKLTEEYINQKPAPAPMPDKKLRSPKEIIKDLKRENNRKIDHVKLSLEYREAFKQQLGKDPWVSDSITEKDADEVAEAYQFLIDEYGHDASEFTFRFDQLLQDDPSVVNALRKKRK